jgi:NAD(P)-dependent dehydrogenase (short-subunit alcohol dehydrogenase family)
MSVHESIRAFAKRAATLKRLDAVILNAGVMTYARSEIDGTETHLAVNVVGTLLLARLLLPTLQRSAERTGRLGRMTVVGSGLMRMVDLSDIDTEGRILEKLNKEGEIPIARYYPISKLLTYYAVKQLARQNPLSKKSNVCVTIQTPGICKSDIFRDDVGIVKWLIMGAASAMLARSTEVGAWLFPKTSQMDDNSVASCSLGRGHWSMQCVQSFHRRRMDGSWSIVASRRK